MKNKFIIKMFLCILSISLFTKNITVYGQIVDSNNINTAINSGDYETAERLARTEEAVNDALSPSIGVYVNENNEIKDFNKDIMGMQCEIMNYGYSFFDRYTNELSDGYLAMAEEIYEIPTARWGGGTANIVGLFNNMGSLDQRTPSYLIDPNLRCYDGTSKVGALVYQPTDMGPVEFIKAIYAVNPDASFMFVLPMDVQTPEESLNFTSFLLDDKDESEWGALRASYGIENPVKLLGYELGNEYYFNAEPPDDKVSGLSDEAYNAYVASEEYAKYRQGAVDAYVESCLNHYNAVHAKYPEVKFYPCVNGRSERVSTYVWNSTVAEKLAHLEGIDGVAYHAYYAAAWYYEDWQIEQLQKIFVEKTGKRTKIVHTEHAFWSSNEGVKRLSLEAALAEAMFITKMQKRDDIISANYHSFTTSGTWGFFVRNGNKYYEMGVNKVYKLFSENYGNKIVESTTDERGTGVGTMFHQLVTKAPDGKLKVTLTNIYYDRNINVDLSFADDYTLIQESVFTAPNQFSLVFNDNTKDIFTVKNTYEEQEHFNHITVPNKSVVVLTLAKPGTFESHASEEQYVDLVKENFDNYETSQSPIALQKDTGINSINTFGDWYTKTYSNVTYNANSSVSIVENEDGGKRVLITPTAVDCNLTNFPMFEYGGSYSNLGNKFSIDYDVEKTSVQTGCGIKFMIHNDGKNYYVLWLNGSKDPQYKWTFSKVENGEIVYSEYGEEYTSSTQDKDGALHSNNNIKVEYDNGKVSWIIDGYEYNMNEYYSSSSYDDPSPFSVSPKETTFAFGCNATRSDNSSIVSYIDNVNVATYSKLIDEYPAEKKYPNLTLDVNSSDEFITSGEPDSVIYVERKVPYSEEGIYHTPEASTVRKIVNNGDTAVKVYVSTDDYSYRLVGEVQPGETKINNLSAKKFSYIKIEGGTDVDVYADLNSCGTFTAIEDIGKISAKVNGSAENEDGKLIPLRTGTAMITASNGTDSVSVPVTVKSFEIYSDDFKSYPQKVVVDTPLGNAVKKARVCGDWWLSQEGSTVSSNPTAYVNNNGLEITAAHIDVFYGAVSYVRYEGDLSGLTNNYDINYDYIKGSVMSGIIFKFHMHNDDKNYYMLLLSGKNGSGHVWTFYKIEDGVVKETIHGEEIAGYTSNPNGPLHDTGSVNISVKGNEISWTINGYRYNKKKYSGGGSFIDSKPFKVDARNTTFAFAVNGEYDTRTGTIKKFSITGDESDKTILQSPTGDESLYVDLSSKGAARPAALFTDGNGTEKEYSMIEDKVGDGFIKIPKSLYENKYSKIYLWDMTTLKPLHSIYYFNK